MLDLNRLGKKEYNNDKVVSEVFKKPIPITIGKPLDKITKVETLEGIVEAPIGYRIVTGVKGEKYPIGEDVFNQYKQVGEDTYAKDKVVVKSMPIKEVGSVVTPWGAKLTAKVGDYLIMESEDNMWVVEEAIYETTYSKVD